MKMHYCQDCGHVHEAPAEVVDGGGVGGSAGGTTGDGPVYGLAPAMGSLAGAAEQTTEPDHPTTVDELQTWLKHNFEVIEGPRTAYFELPVSEVQINGSRWVMRVKYVVLGYQSRLPRRDSEATLVKALWQDLCVARQQASGRSTEEMVEDADRPVLFLRRAPEIAQDFDTERTSITIRLAIPGADLEDMHDYQQRLPEAVGV